MLVETLVRPTGLIPPLHPQWAALDLAAILALPTAWLCIGQSNSIMSSTGAQSAERLWELLQRDEPVRALGAMTGGQAVQMIKAGLEAIYLSGWQVAADANLSGSTYPDQSLYPANSAPALVKRLNNALMRSINRGWPTAAIA